MPRLADTDFLSTRTWLSQLSDDALQPDRTYLHLTAREQWDLHAYFQFTAKLSDQDALAHRRAVTQIQPSLPQRAGRVLARLNRLIEHGPATDPTYQRQRQAARRSALAYANAHDRRLRVLEVRAEMKPEPDAKKFAQALIQIARHQVAARGLTASTPPPGSPRTDPQSSAASTPTDEAA